MITIDEDQLYKLIREMKEFRKAMPKETTKDMMRRHKIKVEYMLLDKILTDEGIEKLISKINHEKNNLEMIKEIAKDEHD